MTENSNDLVGVYERTIRASLARIWENVRDWEHLPWLHAESFAGVRLIEESDDGWTADVKFPGGAEARIRVALEIAALRYTTSTVSGVGAGTDIVTKLRPADREATDIEVSFHVPGIAEADRASVFAAYRDLYRELWDQDETMMRERQSFLANSGVRAANADASVLIEIGENPDVENFAPRTVSVSGKPFRVLELDGAIVAYSARCPHAGGPLGEAGCEHGTVTCPWHGYRFDVRTGECVSGPALRLAAAPQVRVDRDAGTVTVAFEK